MWAEASPAPSRRVKAKRIMVEECWRGRVVLSDEIGRTSRRLGGVEVR